MAATPSERQASELARLGDIRRLGTDRAAEAAETLVDAFSRDPFLNWLLEGSAPTEAARQVKHQQYWLWCCQHILPDQEMHALGDLSAVAMWYPYSGLPTVERNPELRSIDSPRPPAAGPGFFGELQLDPFERFCLSLLGSSARFLQLLQVLRDCSYVMRQALGQQPAWYLAVVGVKRSMQGRGLGAKLLDVMLRRCDRLGLPAFLESSTQRNVAFYRRLGFELLADPLPSLIEVPGGEPLIPMLRLPQADPQIHA